MDGLDRNRAAGSAPGAGPEDARPKIIVVCGPTATGKSGLALALAKAFSGEVISADSMQVYSGLTIGTAAVTPQQADGVPHHLVGFLPPQTPYSVADWLADADPILHRLVAAGKTPIVCGGTGLYIKALVEGIRYDADPADPALRSRLEARWEAEGPDALWQALHQRDPERAARLHLKDRKRILRALELVLLTGQTARQREQASRRLPPAWQSLCLGLTCPDRQALYQRIDRRVGAMLADGLLAEARTVWENRDRYKTAAQAIGYKELFACLAGEAGLDECVDRLKQATRNYAKRQLTWFRGMASVRWLDCQQPDYRQQALALAEAFLGRPAFQPK